VLQLRSFGVGAALSAGLLLTACAGGSAGADGPAGTAPTAAPSSGSCSQPLYNKFHAKECRAPTDPGPPSTGPVPFSRPYVFGEHLVMRVTKISHPSADKVAIAVTTTNSANRMPPDLDVEPFAALTWPLRPGLKPVAQDPHLSDTGFWFEPQPAYNDGHSDGKAGVAEADSFDPDIAGRTLKRNESISTLVTFTVPAKYQRHVLLNFAINDDGDATFIGSVAGG
jgi:hypothetical protein